MFDIFKNSDSINSFNFDLLSKIILNTQKNKNTIIEEWNNFYSFLNEFPEYAAQFNNDFDMCEEYLIDDYGKIYNQMKQKSSKELLANPYFNLHYFEYAPELEERWQKENVTKGEIDTNGILNTGCCVLFKVVVIDSRIFINQYFGLLN